MVRLSSFIIGRLRQVGGYVAIAPGDDNPNDTAPAQFGGILGPDMLEKFDADFDFGGNKLNLLSQDHCAGKVVYWNAPAVAVVPYTRDSGHISFPMTLDGKRVRAILDTGATRTDLNLTVARRAFSINPSAPDVEKVGELKGTSYTADVYRKRFRELAVDGVTVTNPVITLLPDMITTTSEPRPTGSLIREVDTGLPQLILGMSVLSKLHVYIASKERKLYITAADPATAGAPAQ